MNTTVDENINEPEPLEQVAEVAEDDKEEAREIERLQNVEYDYVEEELCPCIFIEYCEGVPLNNHPEVIREQEAEFHDEMLARKDELLQHQKPKKSSEIDEEDEMDEEMEEDEEDMDEGIDVESDEEMDEPDNA
jgi:hypothetical protein